MRKGEFICIIGDVGAGKTSLLKAIIGDMIFISNEEIAAQGGLDTVLDDKAIEEWRTKLLKPDYMEDTLNKPI